MTRGERGFTFIEVIVVMAVLGLLIWVALPRSFASDIRRDAAARELQSDIRYAQELAMTAGKRHRIRFYVTPTNQYKIVKFDGSEVDVGNPLTGAPSFVVDLNNPLPGVQLDSGAPSYLEFDSLGRPSDSVGLLTADKTISLNSGAKVITVTAETGRVSF